VPFWQGLFWQQLFSQRLFSWQPSVLSSNKKVTAVHIKRQANRADFLLHVGKIQVSGREKTAFYAIFSVFFHCRFGWDCAEG
jgi:hypothetical protein